MRQVVISLIDLHAHSALPDQLGEVLSVEEWEVVAHSIDARGSR